MRLVISVLYLGSMNFKAFDKCLLFLDIWSPFFPGGKERVMYPGKNFLLEFTHSSLKIH